jgi:tRNA1Val (adenine37-N6)-methyltransferase
MSETYFHFRRFTVYQDKCAMKVGTDAVLLGAWTNAGAKRILDIGTGSGVIALMLAQKSNASIDAIEIDHNAFIQAKQNFESSPWNDRLSCIHQSFQDFSKSTSHKYDLIVTNPPYFHHASKPPVESRLNARHCDALTFDDLVSGVKNLLTTNGRFCAILPSKEGKEFLEKAQKSQLFCSHLLRVKTKSDKTEKRLIMEFGFRFTTLTDDEIIIQDDEGSFTQQYIDLTKDYYLQLRQSQSSIPQM